MAAPFLTVCLVNLANLVNLVNLENLEQLETLVKPRTPNPHPLLLAIQRLYNRLPHSFQRVAVDVLQVIV